MNSADFTALCGSAEVFQVTLRKNQHL